MNGWTDAPLSARGAEEASLLLARLASEQLAAVHTSPLRRARQVAERLASRAPLSIDPELREIGCGTVDGWHVERVRHAYPLLWRRNALQDDEEFRWPGGESCREFRDRCLRAVRRAVDAHPGGRVGVVTHAGVVAQLLGHLAGLSCARWNAFRPGNASITTVVFCGAGARLVAFDDRSHLAASNARSAIA